MMFENKIVEVCLSRYDKNLVAILIFGSYNTGQFAPGVSDIDTIILLKQQQKLDFKQEQDELRNSLAKINLSIQHFDTIDNYRQHIYEGASWSSWITILTGSRAIYATPEFTAFKEFLATHELDKQKLKEYLAHKDEFELEGYFKQKEGWELTKGIFSHMRRKLQIINYYTGNDLEFDYFACLQNIRKLKERRALKELGKLYKKRESIPQKEIEKYYTIAKKLTEDVMKI